MRRSGRKKRNGHDRQFTWRRAQERLGWLQTTVWERVKRAGIGGRGGFATLVCVEDERERGGGDFGGGKDEECDFPFPKC